MQPTDQAAIGGSTPLPPDFSFLRHWCEKHGKNYEVVKAETEARLRGDRSALLAPYAETHSCVDNALSASEAKRQARALKRASLPIPCPFCKVLTREQQVAALMDLLFDSIVEVAKGVQEGGTK